MVCEYRPLVGAAVPLRAHWALSTSAPVDTTPVVPPDIKPPLLKVRTLEAFAAVALAGVALTPPERITTASVPPLAAAMEFLRKVLVPRELVIVENLSVVRFKAKSQLVPLLKVQAVDGVVALPRVNMVVTGLPKRLGPVVPAAAAVPAILPKNKLLEPLPELGEPTSLTFTAQVLAVI